MLLDVLSAAQSPNCDDRTAAEQHLAAAGKQPGFGLALVRVAVNQDVPADCRQVAALLLKNFLKKHWSTDSEGFEVRLFACRLTGSDALALLMLSRFAFMRERRDQER